MVENYFKICILIFEIFLYSVLRLSTPHKKYVAIVLIIVK